MDFQEIHQQLLEPAAYPEPTGSVTFVETHISRVFLTETRAYKLKKPLKLGFLDFSPWSAEVSSAARRSA